jgi:hypothetical protein
MFDLESAIGAWKREAMGCAGLNAELLLELEDHLREATASLVAAGRSEEAAWGEATSRLGSAEQIAREWAKAVKLGGWDRAAFAAMGGMAALVVVGAVGAIAYEARESLQRQPLLASHVLTITVGYALGLLAAAAGGYATLRRAAAGRSARVVTATARQWIRWTGAAATALTAVGFVLGCVWAKDALGAAFSSDPREWGGLAALASIAAATWAAWRQTPRAIAATGALAVVGGGVILMTWLGGAYLTQESSPRWFATVAVGAMLGSLALAALSMKSGERGAA